MRKEYVAKLAGMMKDSGLDAVLVCPSEELKFFIGFSPMMCERFQGLFIKDDGSCFYVCNLIYGGEMRRALPDEVPVYTWFDCDGMLGPVEKILREQGLIGKKVGVNSSAQAFNVLDLAGLGISFVNAKPLLEEVRIRKTPEELERMRQVAAIADAVYEPVINFIKPGMKEEQVRDFMYAEMSKRGGYNMWAIVGSGPNSSYPHYLSYDRVIQEGDCIVLDWGCEYQEMQSDMSRTVFVGSITDEQRECYELSARATATAEAAVKEGAFIPDIDAIARQVLDEKGYAKTLINRTGHGIGYMEHEGPYINACNPRRLERGMCFSIEPGIYLTDRFGMRVEDIVAINEKGETEILNHARRDLIIIK